MIDRLLALFAFLPRFAMIGALSTSLLLSLSNSASAKPVLLDRTIVELGDGLVTYREFEDFLKYNRMKIKLNHLAPPPKKDWESSLLNEMILLRSQLMLAKNGLIQVSDDFVLTSLGRLAKSNHLTLSQLKNKLNRMMPGGFEIYRRNFKNELTVGRLQMQAVGSSVSQEEVESFYSLLRQQQPVTLLYLLNYKEGKQLSKPELLKLFHQYKSKPSLNLETGDYRLVGYQNKKPTELAGLIQGLLPEKVGTYRYRANDSGTHYVYLVSQVNAKNKVTLYHLARILLRNRPGLNPSLAHKRFGQIMAQYQSGASFDKLAATYSEDYQTNLQGGKMPPVPLDVLPASIQSKVAHMKPGQVTSVIKTNEGYQVFKLLRIETRKGSPESIKSRIRMSLTQARFSAQLATWHDRMVAEAYVNYLPRLEPSSKAP